jgi:hypothetical protein
MKNVIIFYLLLITPAALLITACSKKEKWKSPAGYDLKKPEVISLTRKIDQISGIAYSSADSSVFAIDDDTGDLYNISLTNEPAITKWKFGKNSDNEDLVLTDSSFYVLGSKGKIFHFGLPITEVQEYELELKGSHEFEILYKDPSANRLIMLCKECNEDNKKRVSAYGFDLDSNTFSDTAVFELKESSIEKVLGKKIDRFKASAASVNPLTGDIFIISSINKLLVVTGSDLTVKQVYELNPELFKQPEGLCFTPWGDLLISNEAGTEGKADILMYRYQSAQR